MYYKVLYMYIHKLDAELYVQKENVLSLQLYHAVILLTVKYFLVFLPSVILFITDSPTGSIHLHAHVIIRLALLC